MSDDWTRKCADMFRAASAQSFYGPHTRNGILNAMSVACHESSLSMGWFHADGSHAVVWNFGALSVRMPTPDEVQRIKAGELGKGSLVLGGFLYGDSSPGHAIEMRVFANDPTPEAGIAHFLRVLVAARAAVAMCIDDGTCEDVARAMYVTGYYEGVHVGARLVGKRTSPFNPGEVANMADYAKTCFQQRVMLNRVLADWGRDLPLGGPAPPYDGANDPAKAAEVGVWGPEPEPHEDPFYREES